MKDLIYKGFVKTAEEVKAREYPDAANMLDAHYEAQKRAENSWDNVRALLQQIAKLQDAMDVAKAEFHAADRAIYLFENAIEAEAVQSRQDGSGK